MDELCPDEMGVKLDPAPVTAGQVMENLTDRGVLTAGLHQKKRRPLRLAARAAVAAALVLSLSVTAWAVGNYTDFFEAVFGDKGLADENGGFVVTVKAASGIYLDHYNILNAAKTTDTVLHGVYYFQPLATEAGGGLGADDVLSAGLNTWGADGVKQGASEVVEISAANRVPSVDLTCGELTARLSPLSLFIDTLEGLEEPWSGASSQERVIRYRDGGEYVLERSSEVEAEQNVISQGVNGYTWEDMTIFNRFVDTAAVADITVTASDGAQYVFRPAA